MELNTLPLNSTELNSEGGTPSVNTTQFGHLTLSFERIAPVVETHHSGLFLSLEWEVWVTVAYRYHRIPYDYFVATYADRDLTFTFSPYVAEVCPGILQLPYDMGVCTLQEVEGWPYITTDFRPYSACVGERGTLAYDIAVLGQRESANGLSLQYAMKQLATTSLQVSLGYSVERLQDRYTGVSLAWFLFDFVPLPFSFSYDVEKLHADYLLVNMLTGIESLTQFEREATVAYAVSPLVDGSQILEVRHGVAQLTTAHAGLTLGYWVRNDEYLEFGLAYDMDTSVIRGAMSLSWEARNEYEISVPFSYRMDYGSDRAFIDCFYTVERYITSGVQLQAGWVALAGVSLQYSLQSIAMSGVHIDIPLRLLPKAGVELPALMSYALAGVQLAAPSINRAYMGVSLDSPWLVEVLSRECRLSSPSFTPSIAGLSLVLPMYALATRGVSIDAPLPLRARATSSINISSPLLNVGAIVRNDTYYLTVNGEDIPLLSGEVSADEGAFAWTGNFVLAQPRDLGKFLVSSQFSITIGADTYEFIVESKSNKRTSPTTLTATVNGISPSALLDYPRASHITKNWVDASTAATIAAEVAPSASYTWSILDWAIPGNRYGVTQSSPLGIIKELATAVGGILDSLPSGHLRVRPKYPITVPSYGPATTDHTYYESEHLLEFEENYSPDREYNKYRIMDDKPKNWEDTLEYTEVTSSTGIMRVYPGPWRTDFLLTTTATVFIGGRVFETRQEEEIIEITEAAGKTKYPVASLVSIEWLDENLHGVVAGGDSRTVTTTRIDKTYSLLKIVYTVRCFAYDIKGSEGRKAQFLVENI